MTVQPFNDEYFMRRALDEARQAAAEGEVPVGAVVVCGDRVIARAHNQTERLNDPTAHAEMLAITAATGAMGAKYLPECRLYVTVEPCVMCAGAIGWAQLGAVVYGAAPVRFWCGDSLSSISFLWRFRLSLGLCRYAYTNRITIGLAP